VHPDQRSKIIVKVILDRDLCNGYGNCVIEAPAAFDLDDSGIGIVLLESPSVDQEDRVRLAAAMCPVEAIRVQD
jgi:ferredoxin